MVDYSMVEKSFSKTEITKKPWEWKRKLFVGMELRLDAVIDKIDNLAKDIELNKMEKHDFDKVDRDVISPGAISMIAENMECQYGSEAFETFQKQERSKEVGDQIVETIIKQDSMR